MPAARSMRRLPTPRWVRAAQFAACWVVVFCLPPVAGYLARSVWLGFLWGWNL